jgi:hypothetical protein
MAKKQEDAHAPPENYAQVRAKIIDGTVTQQELSTLYDHYAAIKTAGSRAQEIQGLIDDLHNSKPKISTEKYHDFASKLVEVEKEKLMKSFPKSDDPELEDKNKKSRCADYFRNTSLAKNVVLDESMRAGVGQDIYQDLAKGKVQSATLKLESLKVPDFLQNHYSSIKQFYKENGNEMGAAKNLSFHIISTAVSTYALQANKPEIVSKMRQVSEVVTPKNDATKTASALQGIIDQIPDEKKALNFPPQKKGLIEWFVEKVKNLLGKKDNSVPIEKTTGTGQEQNVPSARKRGEEVVERPELVGPALKPRELQPTRKRANAMDKAKAEEIGKMAKSTKPKPKLEGQKQQVKQQDSGMARK